jgi:4-diphosphocytidyl-2-C-methyl-D-erythritol kinase
MRLETLAPAKINLFLHVGPVDAEGYHPLSSLVAFADIGDRIVVEPADRLSLTVEGPFATGLTSDDNLILRALRRLGEATGRGEPGLSVVLDKRLPIAAGLGGGSSDAGAALRLAARFLDLEPDDRALEAAARSVGADGPMCLHARTAWAEGWGERLTTEPRLPALPVVLVNPGVPSPTGAVYRAYDAGPVGAADRPDPPSTWTPRAVAAWLATLRNDLEAPALGLTPDISGALEAVAASDGVLLSRMSGSGATVFGLYSDAEAARAAAHALSTTRPGWWVRAGFLGG